MKETKEYCDTCGKEITDMPREHIRITMHNIDFQRVLCIECMEDIGFYKSSSIVHDIYNCKILRRLLRKIFGNKEER